MTRGQSSRRVSYVIRDHQQEFGGHLLGINSLAVDTTTLVSGSETSQGILYSAGRDGMIAAWNLHLKKPSQQNSFGISSQSGYQKRHSRSNGTHKRTFSSKFDTEDEIEKTKSTPICCTQAHSDWINDIVICHQGQSIISASNDQTVKLWQPYNPSHPEPITIGTHLDYIKCLVHAKHTNWVASGGFDRKIHFWDIGESIGCRKPILSISEVSAKGSIYALGCNPSGTILASGSPEKVVRVWDPRSGTRITKFTGHTDNIRAILISDDGKSILTSSSDTTIKLWSLTVQRCISTFTMHSKSVWSLYSSHPDLRTFYAGDRGGLVTKTELLMSNDITDGECVALFREQDSVNKVVALQDQYIWASTCTSHLHRWRDIPSRTTRLQSFSSSTFSPCTPTHQASSPTTFDYNSGLQSSSPGILSPSRGIFAGIPSESTIKIISDDLYSMQTAIMVESDVSTLYSAASVLSMPVNMEVGQESGDDAIPLRETWVEEIPGKRGLVKHLMLNDRRHVLTADSEGKVDLWDIIKCTKIREFGLNSIEEVEKELSFMEATSAWCDVDTRIGTLTVHLSQNRCFDGEIYADQAGLEDMNGIKEDQRINLGKWVLRNLFNGFIDAELNMEEELSRKGLNSRSPHQQGDLLYKKSMLDISPSQSQTASNDSIPKSYSISQVINHSTQMQTSGLGIPGSNGSTSTSTSTNMSTNTTTSTNTSTNMNTNMNTNLNGTSMNDMHSVQRGQNKETTTNADLNNGNANVRNNDDNASTGSRKSDSGSASSSNVIPSCPTTPSSPGSSNTFMGRLKQLGVRKPKSPMSEKTTNLVGNESNKTSSIENGVNKRVSTDSEKPRDVRDEVLNPPFSPPLAIDIPLIQLPSHILVTIEEEAPIEIPEVIKNEEGNGKNSNITIIEPIFFGELYRGTIGQMYEDYEMIENAAPSWLLSYLLKNQIFQKEAPRLSFVLKPYANVTKPISDMPNSNTRLTANRMLRVRKITAYVATKLQENNNNGEEFDPELLEILCQDQILEGKMTLGCIRMHLWKQGGPDLLLQYRWKEIPRKNLNTDQQFNITK